MAATKILLFRNWDNHPIVDSIVYLLNSIFPHSEIRVITITENIRSRMCILLLNTLWVYFDYGWDILRKRRRFKLCFWRTPFIFKYVKRLAAKYANQDDYIFSFQLHSLFDMSSPGLPHFVYTDHTHLANLKYKDFDPALLYKTNWINLEKTIYHNATKVFTWGTNISKNLIEAYQCSQEKVSLVYSGPNRSLENIPLENENFKNKNILYVGVNWSHKGGIDLERAFAKVLDRHPDARLTVVGCSPDVQVPNINVIGRVSVDHIDKHYQEASVFCLPTKREAFGTVFIEAMSMRLPVVAPNIGSIPDFVIPGETGFLFEPGDIDGIADALGELLGSAEKCQKFGENGHKLYQEKYNWVSVSSAIRESIIAELESRV